MELENAAQVLPVFWETGKKLDPNFAEGLIVNYLRVPFFEEGEAPLVRGADVDLLLRRASEHKTAKWAAVIADGNVFRSQFRIVIAVNKFLSSLKTEFLVCGHLINKQGYYCGLHEQFFLVNLDVYRKLGYPKFGEYERAERELHNYEAGESVHDDYTPKYLLPLSGKTLRKTKVCGWNFVHSSLEAGLPVLNLPDAIRDSKNFLYPNDNNEALNRNIVRLMEWEYLENPTQRKTLMHLLMRKMNLSPTVVNNAFDFKDRSNCLFFFNTEALYPLKEGEALAMPNGKGPLDVYSGPCAGFQDLVFLSLYGAHSKTRVVYFDINERAFEMKETILREFNGEVDSLPRLIEDLQQRYAKLETYAGPIEQKIEDLLRFFNGDREKLRDNWLQLREMPREYVHLNLIEEPTKLFKKFKAQEKILLNISDIFLAQNEVLYGAFGISNKFEEFCSFAKAFKDLYLAGLSLPSGYFEAKASSLDLRGI